MCGILSILNILFNVNQPHTFCKYWYIWLFLGIPSYFSVIAIAAAMNGVIEYPIIKINCDAKLFSCVYAVAVVQGILITIIVIALILGFVGLFYCCDVKKLCHKEEEELSLV